MDLEKVLSRSIEIDQTWALLEDCCIPLGEDLNLMKLPSWAINQITFSDGNFIKEKVLPSFLLPQEK